MIKVCIDAGHGGKDRANKGKTGYIEADGVLDISLKLRDELISTGAFEVKLTRDKDMTLGVRERGNIAASWGADMFISEHSNATGLPNNTARRGVDVYTSVDLNDDKLAKDIANAVALVMGTKGLACKRESTNYADEDYYGVIDSAQDGGVKHVILIENGFHDNLQDEAILKDTNKRLAIAKAQAKVICEFYGIAYHIAVKKEDNINDELEKALQILSTKKIEGDVIVNSPQYWSTAIQKKEVNFQWLESLIVKTARYLEKV